MPWSRPLASRALPHTERQSHGFDRVAALLCAGLFGCAVLGFESLSHGGAWAPVTAEWVVAVVCGMLLWRRQAEHPAPMLAVDLFRAPSFALSAATSICSFSAQGLGFVSLPFLLQSTLGYSAVRQTMSPTLACAGSSASAPMPQPSATRPMPPSRPGG